MDIAIIGAAGMLGQEATRAIKLGFTAESSLDDVIQAHIEDELNGNMV